MVGGLSFVPINYRIPERYLHMGLYGKMIFSKFIFKKPANSKTHCESCVQWMKLRSIPFWKGRFNLYPPMIILQKVARLKKKYCKKVCKMDKSSSLGKATFLLTTTLCWARDVSRHLDAPSGLSELWKFVTSGCPNSARPY